jgi:hypothetical protein
MVLKEDPAVIDVGDLTAEAGWREEGLPTAGIPKIIGMEALLKGVTFSGHNFTTDHLNRKNRNEKSNHQINRYQVNLFKQQRSGT